MLPMQGTWVQIPGQGTRSHVLQLRVCMQQLKILHAATKTWRKQVNTLKKKYMYISAFSQEGRLWFKKKKKSGVFWGLVFLHFFRTRVSFLGGTSQFCPLCWLHAPAICNPHPSQTMLVPVWSFSLSLPSA